MPNFTRARVIKYMKYFLLEYDGWHQPKSKYLWACGKLGHGVGTGVATFLGKPARIINQMTLLHKHNCPRAPKRFSGHILWPLSRSLAAPKADFQHFSRN